MVSGEVSVHLEEICETAFDDANFKKDCLGAALWMANLVTVKRAQGTVGWTTVEQARWTMVARMWWRESGTGAPGDCGPAFDALSDEQEDQLHSDILWSTAKPGKNSINTLIISLKYIPDSHKAYCA